MFKNALTLTILLFSLAFLPMSSYAQAMDNRDSQTFKEVTPLWQFGITPSLTQFYGDASNSGYFKKFSGETSFGAEFLARRYVSPVWAVGAALYTGGVKSHKTQSATGTTVDYVLNGNYFDFQVQLYGNLSNLLWGLSPRRLSLTGSIGLGYASWSTELADNLSGLIVYSGDVVNGTTTKKGGAVVPLALGLDYAITDNWHVYFGGNLRTVLNDDMDTWVSGFRFDQLFSTQFGISYQLMSGKRSASSKAKKSVKPVSNCPDSGPGQTVPFYDYRYQPARWENSASAPVAPPAKTYTQQQPVKPASEDIDQAGLYFSVQILATSKAVSLAGLESKVPRGMNVIEHLSNGLYRYSVGSYGTYREALSHVSALKQSGFTDAFVVAYRGNQRVSITEKMK